MQYHPDDFMRLMEEAERQGSAHLNDYCEPKKFRQPQPTPKGMRETDLFTHGCNQQTKFMVPYDPARHVIIPAYNGPDDPDGDNITHTVSVKENNAVMNRGGGFATVCASGDAMGRWPRFAKVIEEEDE